MRISRFGRDPKAEDFERIEEGCCLLNIVTDEKYNFDNRKLYAPELQNLARGGLLV